MTRRVSLSIPLSIRLRAYLFLLQSGSQSLLSVLAPENQAWDLTVTPFTLPPRTRLLLADIHAGSNTPLLVSKVLKWRAENSSVGEFHLVDYSRPACLMYLIGSTLALDCSRPVQHIARPDSRQTLGALRAR
jgi:hypothetical protein